MKAAFLFLLAAGTGFSASWVGFAHNQGDFPLSHDGSVAGLLISADDFKVVDLATHDLQKDIERVTGHLPEIHFSGAKSSGPTVIIGTIGKSPLIDTLARSGKIDLSALRGQWETFVIATVVDPLPGISQGLVIAGSDRRGTAYGVYELSEAIGVSPWHWWADVAPAKKNELSIRAGTRRFGPPSVQYRGIFLNDEDWGLQPWAAKTFEPETGDIGPRTYARICELLLRLKANTLWPAMHPCTKAFNLHPQNKIVADDYAIVMGSSHAEPMLRNNVTEWKAPHQDYNYVTHRDDVRAYWEKRVRENGRYENIYTLGMRGIHDSSMQGPKTDAERIRTLETIFADQRALLQQNVHPDLKSIPQIFCAYKEVLPLYRQGLKVPDDVTIMWPDDNFGYVRDFADPTERKRSGGFGIYYHISYLGAPLSYLWLETTPPSLIWEEMSKAYDHGARKVWIVNVGDLKPGEIGTEFFLQMAWDIDRWKRGNLTHFLPEWAAREFGADHAAEIAKTMAGYYRLNFQRRPEHLQWWLPGKPPRPSPFTGREIDRRLRDFSQLRSAANRIAAQLPDAKRDAFEELVGYPVRGAALANVRYFEGERGNIALAQAADAELHATTRHFNEELAGGKWNRILSLEPADNQWNSMRLAPWKAPEFKRAPDKIPGRKITISTTDCIKSAPGYDRNWASIPGLGIAVFPTTAPMAETAGEMTRSPRMDYEFETTQPGVKTLTIQLLPTHPIVAARGLRFGFSLDDESPRTIVCAVQDGSPEWAQGVLNNYVSVSVDLPSPAAGKHRIHLFGMDPGVVIREMVIDQSGIH